MSSIPEDVKKRVIELKKEGKNHRTIARVTGVSVGSVSNITSGITGFVSREGPPVEVESDERDGDNRLFKKVINRRIKSLEELVEACEIDTSEWEIYKWKCVAWQTGMVPRAVGKTNDWSRSSTDPMYSQQFSVSAWMRLRKAVIAAKNEIEELRKKAEKFAPKYAPYIIKGRKDSGVLGEISIVDHHFGALIWGKETGSADYDTKIATECWKDCVATLSARTKAYKPERILLVIGNDQQNADNRAGTTEKGTPQNNDSRYQKVFQTSFDATQWAADQFVAHYENLDVLVVPGNHDPVSAWHLGHSLSVWYRNNPNVKVDYSPNPKKYLRWGEVMLLHTHGEKGSIEKYHSTMAAEQPRMWGETTWREAHTADKHHRRLIELPGATVRILPSLRPPDAWTSENHYVGSVRAAEAYMWSRTEALIGTCCYSILGKGETA